jgi:hypothetical protein
MEFSLECEKVKKEGSCFASVTNEAESLEAKKMVFFQPWSRKGIVKGWKMTITLEQSFHARCEKSEVVLGVLAREW